MNIKDAASGRTVGVNNVGQVSTDGDGLLRDSYEIGKSYVWLKTTQNIDAADTMITVRNLSDVPLSIDKVIITGGDVISNYKLHIETLPYAFSGGGYVAGVNVNYANGNPKNPPAEAWYDDDGVALVAGNILYEPRIGIDETYVQETPGLILGNGITFSVDQVTASTVGYVAVYGHYLY